MRTQRSSSPGVKATAAIKHILLSQIRGRASLQNPCLNLKPKLTNERLRSEPSHCPDSNTLQASVPYWRGGPATDHSGIGTQTSLDPSFLSDGPEWKFLVGNLSVFDYHVLLVWGATSDLPLVLAASLYSISTNKSFACTSLGSGVFLLSTNLRTWPHNRKVAITVSKWKKVTMFL